MPKKKRDPNDVVTMPKLDSAEQLLEQFENWRESTAGSEQHAALCNVAARFLADAVTNPGGLLQYLFVYSLCTEYVYDKLMEMPDRLDECSETERQRVEMVLEEIQISAMRSVGPALNARIRSILIERQERDEALTTLFRSLIGIPSEEVVHDEGEDIDPTRFSKGGDA